MGDIEVVAGDFLKGTGSFDGSTLTLKTKRHSWMGESFSPSAIQDITIADAKMVKELSAALGWGLVFGALFGPVGALFGAVAGGNRREVVFIANFKNGSKLLASTDSDTFTELQAAVFDGQSQTSSLSLEL
jgi:hypothetical protein